MTRLSFFLLLAVLASALYLVSVQYESRQLYSELDRARSQARNIETDNERLQVEKRAQAAPLRVEKLAKEQLQMRTVTPAITHYAHYAGAASNAPHAHDLASAQSGSAVVGRIQ